MISAEEWWSIIEAYDDRIWSAHTVFYIVAILLTGWFLLKPGLVQNWFTKFEAGFAIAVCLLANPILQSRLAAQLHRWTETSSENGCQ